MADVVRSDGDRNEAVAASMAQARESGECPFCAIARNKKPDQPILFQVGGWAVINNLSPEDGSRLHLLAISVDHPVSNHHSDLPAAVRLAEADVIIRAEAEYPWLRDWSYSVYSRRGHDGVHNAMTIYHPHFHIVASDGMRVYAKQLNPNTRRILEANRISIIASFRQRKPKKAARAAQKGETALFSEALKLFWQDTNGYRSWLEQKAYGIWIKISNQAT